MYHRYDHATEKPQRNESLLSVGDPGVLERKRGSFENTVGISKVEPVIAEVRPALALIPDLANIQIVYTLGHQDKHTRVIEPSPRPDSLRLTTRIPAGPANDSVTRLGEMIQMLYEPLRAQQRERANVRARQLRLQPRRGREQRAPPGDNIVDEYDPADLTPRWWRN